MEIPFWIPSAPVLPEGVRNLSSNFAAADQGGFESIGEVPRLGRRRFVRISRDSTSRAGREPECRKFSNRSQSPRQRDTAL
jgi:hypothetical protein